MVRISFVQKHVPKGVKNEVAVMIHSCPIDQGND